MAPIHNQVYAAFSFIALCLCLTPLPWHLEAWNTGTCLNMLWLATGLLIQFVNAVVWNHNAINWAPVWCDISTRLIAALTVAIPASNVCIMRRLYLIASVRTVTVTRAERLRSILVDLSIGLGFPLFFIFFYSINQGHRFDIFEYYGCQPTVYITVVAIPTYFIWPVVISCISVVYSVLAIRAFYKRQTQFKELLSGNRNLTPGRYIRLILLAATNIFFAVPISSYFLYLNTSQGFNPWISWADTHYNFSRVVQVSSITYRFIPGFVSAYEISRWSFVLLALLFFGYFGFAEEARKNYRSAYESIAKRVGYSTGTLTSTTCSFGGVSKEMKVSSFTDSTLTSVPRLEKNGKRSSFDSFDAGISLGDVGGLLVKDDFSPTATSSGSSTAAQSLPPSADDTYSISGAHDSTSPDATRPNSRMGSGNAV